MIHDKMHCNVVLAVHDITSQSLTMIMIKIINEMIINTTEMGQKHGGGLENEGRIEGVI